MFMWTNNVWIICTSLMVGFFLRNAPSSILVLCTKVNCDESRIGNEMVEGLMPDRVFQLMLPLYLCERGRLTGIRERGPINV